MTSATGKLTARSASRHVRLVSLAAQGLRQKEIAGAEGCSEALVSRLLRRDEVKAEVEALRAQALLSCWSQFQILLDKSIHVLSGILENPVADRRLKAMIALKLFELGITLPATPLTSFAIEKSGESSRPLTAVANQNTDQGEP